MPVLFLFYLGKNVPADVAVAERRLIIGKGFLNEITG